jgi:hypothetical protein
VCAVERGTPRWALLGSAAVHLLVVGLAVAFLRLGPEQLPERGPVERVEYFELDFPEETVGAPLPAGGGEAPAPGAAPLPTPRGPADRRRERAAEGPALVFPNTVPRTLPGAAGVPAPSGAAGGAAPSGAGATGAGPGALRPGLRDPRLYAPEHPPAEAPQPTEHERYMGRLHAKLGEYNDSIMAEEERARKATDWTVKGKDGERWGLSPGKIHLGKTTIPNPVGITSNSPERDEEARKEARQRREIDRQVGDRQRRDSFKERVKATRERKDAERKAKSGGT